MRLIRNSISCGEFQWPSRGETQPLFSGLWDGRKAFFDPPLLSLYLSFVVFVSALCFLCFLFCWRIAIVCSMYNRYRTSILLFFVMHYSNYPRVIQKSHKYYPRIMQESCNINIRILQHVMRCVKFAFFFGPNDFRN